VTSPTTPTTPTPLPPAAQGWVERVRALQVIAQEGLAYTQDPWDRDRFGRLRELAALIADEVLDGVLVDGPPLAGATSDGSAAGQESRGPATSSRPPGVAARAVLAETGYLTPKLDVRAAVHDASGRLLLVREVSDGRWALPGGWADVGETLAEGVVREVREETGFAVEVERLLGIYDRERWGHPSMLHFTLKSVLRCRIVGGEATPSPETDAVAWFARDDLPPLSRHRNSPELVARIFAHHDDPGLSPDL
jgi:ADP-ribose pyrophosphatase YjhB (NUDIX family)